MTYQRKTYDEYEIMTNYGWGWEAEYTALSMQEARRAKQEYIDNARDLKGIYIKHRRIKKEG